MTHPIGVLGFVCPACRKAFRLFWEVAQELGNDIGPEAGKSDVGWGHQIRSCVPENSRIKDLRSNVEISNTQKELDGDLDAFIEASLKQGV